MSAFRTLQKISRSGGAAVSKLSLLSVPVLALSILALSAGPASAGTPGTGWSIRSVAQPTSFSASDKEDRYAVAAVNLGSRPAKGDVSIADTLPGGVMPVEMKIEEPASSSTGACSLAELKCTYTNPVRPDRELLVTISVKVSSRSLSGPLVNEATLSEAGGGEASANASNPVNVRSAPFGIAGFAFEADGVDGMPDMQGGAHPYDVTTTIDLNTIIEPVLEPEHQIVAQDARDVAVTLPLGFAGDPLATERCPEVDVNVAEGTIGTPTFHTACPAASEVGTASLSFGLGSPPTPPYPVYNLIPEHGYPAELGVNAGISQPVFLYASVVHDASGYRLRVATPGVIRLKGDDVESVRLTVFGDPGEVDGTGNKTAFVRSPTGCSHEPLKANLYVTSWEGREATAEATAYPEVTGCNLLQGASAFDPSIEVKPETTQEDTPSGYEVDLKLPQAPNMFGALATPDLKNATVTLPAGVSLSPSAASGPDALAGCNPTGSEGINIGSTDIAADGQDLGDPEATELGEGHPDGDSSPYDDGMWHTAPGHCPENSRVGTVEVKTPLLEEALHGNVYLAQPECGGAGQHECSDAYAEGKGGPSGEGSLYGIYLELAGSGVILKLKGNMSVNPTTGQITTTFRENPQLPFEEFKLTFPGRQRAALANPQTCGAATTTSDLEPWSHTPVPGEAEGTPNATPSSSFAVSGCAGAMPFNPGFDAGTVTPIAGGYSPFVLQLSRQDGEQDLLGLEATLPKGLLAKLAGVPECGEAQANAGTCSSESQIGTVTVTAGAGSEPLQESGRIYLTGPYNGGPFGESVVIPAVAGPFNLGDVVVRGSIRIDPNTAQASIVSNPFPTVVDGVAVRVRTVNVEVNRPAFTFNPTDCDSQAVTATVSAAQGGSAAVSSPFAVTGCATLPFKPSFTASTRGKTSRIDGASLVVKVAQKPGEANIHLVHLAFPKVLPARLSTLRGACTEAQFAANPSGCPAGSVIGTGTAVTPVLSAPLSGPAYLVSHGGAAYPDVVFVLQGDGVTIDLTGVTDIKKGIAYSTFETVPDAPVTSFEARLPEGPHAVFGANLPAKAKGSFCGRTLTIPITIDGQNGAVVKQSTKLKVTSCPKKKKHRTTGKGGKQRK